MGRPPEDERIRLLEDLLRYIYELARSRKTGSIQAVIEEAGLRPTEATPSVGRESHRRWRSVNAQRIQELEAEVAAQARVIEAAQRAIFIAEHLFPMVPREVWRDQGIEWMGQYEGDYYAEGIRNELISLGEKIRAAGGETETPPETSR